MRTPVFVYGTLKRPEVQRAVLGQVLAGVPDTLAGYRKSAIALDGVYYPNIVPARDGAVEGLVLSLNASLLSRADAYEGEAYQRVEVKLASGKPAWVYIAAAATPGQGVSNTR